MGPDYVFKISICQFLIFFCLIPVCHTDLSGSAGLFTSENFPENYKASTNCTWNITVPEGQRVQLTFHLLNVSITSKSVTPHYCIFQPAFGCCSLQMLVKILLGERPNPREESSSIGLGFLNPKLLPFPC